MAPRIPQSLQLRRAEDFKIDASSRSWLKGYRSARFAFAFHEGSGISFAAAGDRKCLVLFTLAHSN